MNKHVRRFVVGGATMGSIAAVIAILHFLPLWLIVAVLTFPLMYFVGMVYTG
jgi:hypothetical protein